MDRSLSELPDDILRHTLSFLVDIESAARTSVLSRRWRHLWNDVPVFHLYLNTYPSSKFEHKLVPLRSHRDTNKYESQMSIPRSYRGTSVDISFRSHKEEYAIIVGRWKPHISTIYHLNHSGGVKAFDRALRRAARLGAGHEVRALSIRDCFLNEAEFAPVASSIARHRHNLHLQKLELVDCDQVDLRAVSDPAFAMLTILELTHCGFNDKDPFAGLPRLNSLKLLFCPLRRGLEISGPQLRKLEVVDSNVEIAKLRAPKLEFLDLSFVDVEELHLFHKLNVPSLHQARVRMCVKDATRRYDQWIGGFTNLMRSLCYAKSLDLCFREHDRNVAYRSSLPGLNRHGERRHLHYGRHQSHKYFGLIKLKSLVDEEVSRFTRLESLSIQYPREFNTFLSTKGEDSVADPEAYD